MNDACDVSAASADTIAAIATPPGRGGVAIVRLSGPEARRIGVSVAGRLGAPRYAFYTTFKDAAGQPMDEGLVLYFPKPRSFTGEDVVEFHGHGGVAVAQALLEAAVHLGARPARPGEFSERAFLNGKIDLAQAEAVADLVDAASREAAQSALRSLRGEFSRSVHTLVGNLTELRVQVEAAIDFPEEEIDFLADEAVTGRLGGLDDEFEQLLRRTREGCVLREGLHVVLAGAPNAGKSSLMNRLSASDRAIVSDIPGTTRDVIEQALTVDGLPLYLIDTAGLREARDQIEDEGIRRAQAAARECDLVLFVVDDTVPWNAAALRTQLPPSVPFLVAINKIDLSGRASGRGRVDDCETVALSAKTGAGMDALRDALKTHAGYQVAGEQTFSARRRHVEAIERALSWFNQACRHARTGDGELMAEELRQAQQALCEITGEYSNDDLLGEIFAHFCIGK